MMKVPYLSAVGSLMYLAICSRPDIAYTVSLLAQFNSNPGKAHWQAVRHLFRYLKGTLDLELTYRSSNNNEPCVVYSNADYAGDKVTLHSTGAYVLKFGTGTVDWSSKLQTVVAQSATEVKYLVAVGAG